MLVDRHRKVSVGVWGEASALRLVGFADEVSASQLGIAGEGCGVFSLLGTLGGIGEEVAAPAEPPAGAVDG